MGGGVARIATGMGRWGSGAVRRAGAGLASFRQKRVGGEGEIPRLERMGGDGEVLRWLRFCAGLIAPGEVAPRGMVEFVARIAREGRRT